MAYKLDITDRVILYELDKNCRISDNQLAKKVNRSREAVRNRIKKLEKDGIIQCFITTINPAKCGYMLFKIYFQLANIPKERERFYDYLKKLPGVYWFGGNDGVWDLHATFYEKDVKAFNKLKNQIYTDFKHLIVKRDVGVLEIARQYVKKYLSETKERPEPIIFAGEMVFNNLDELDKKIINALIRDARISLIDLAKKTDATVDIIRRRMKRMEDSEIIEQYRIAIDHVKLGYEMFKAFIYFNNLSEKDEMRLLEFAKQHTKIVYVIKQLSSWDIELEIMAENYEEFANIMNEIRLLFAEAIRNYEFAFMREDLWMFQKYL